MVKPKMKPVAPDGGWGWIIVLAFAGSNIVAIPILQGFGLLFRNLFAELKLTATDIGTIINVNSAFGLMLGLMNGPMLRRFGYRKVAITGSLFMFFGFVGTSQAASFTQFIIFYGVINSIGLSMSMSAFSLAMNTYFLKRRSKSSGFCTTLTGLGPVFMPLLMSKLMDFYGTRGTALILAGLLLHSFMASLLLHPIKWHYKYVAEEEPENETLIEKEEEKADLDYDHISVHGIENATIPHRISETTRLNGGLSVSRLSLFEKETVIEPDSKWWSKESNDDTKETMNVRIRRLQSIDARPRLESIQEENNVIINKNRWYHKVIKFFDLDLLKDPIYRNIWLGMSIAFTGEINFSLSTPLILGDRNFEIESTARIMSVIATSDIIFRFISPFIGDAIKLPARQMYMISLLLLIVTRFALTLVYSYEGTLVVAVALGIAKGLRTVYMSLVIPNHVSLDKLPSASGLQTVLNGVLLMTFGPIIGLARDATGNYNILIHIVNLLSLTTILLWTTEIIIVKYKKKKSESSKADKQII